MLAAVTGMQLFCMQLARLEEAGRLTDTIAGLAKLNNTRTARHVIAEARDLLGGNGVLLENHVGSRAASWAAAADARPARGEGESAGMTDSLSSPGDPGARSRRGRRRARPRRARRRARRAAGARRRDLRNQQHRGDHRSRRPAAGRPARRASRAPSPGSCASGGAAPRGSQLLDGVFFSSDFGTTTFERSRRFDVDRVDPAELQEIAETIGTRFHQESVLTFDNLAADDPAVDAIELEVPGVTADALRAGLLADQEAAEPAVRRLRDARRAPDPDRRPRRRGVRPRVRRDGSAATSAAR